MPIRLSCRHPARRVPGRARPVQMGAPRPFSGPKRGSRSTARTRRRRSPDRGPEECRRVHARPTDAAARLREHRHPLIIECHRRFHSAPRGSPANGEGFPEWRSECRRRECQRPVHPEEAAPARAANPRFRLALAVFSGAAWCLASWRWLPADAASRLARRLKGGNSRPRSWIPPPRNEADRSFPSMLDVR